jgi:hypothetical protein
MELRLHPAAGRGVDVPTIRSDRDDLARDFLAGPGLAS